MKKLSILIATIALLSGISVQASETANTETNAKPAFTMKRHPNKEMVRQKFEQRLNLTEKQKKKAKTIHEKGMEQMKPIMEQSGEIRKNMKALKDDKNLDETLKKEQMNKYIEELKSLDKKARDIRKENSKEFEKILNKKQKEELSKIKSEGRANFEKHHPPRPPFNMFGAPDFWNKKPLFTPPAIE
ncbi:Spy/CpxP family protein refolding chaperone [bacterium]|nr:Spy/CpxP family protein refolding chaperone [bacterium]